MATDKTTFINQCISIANIQAQAREAALAMRQVWIDRGYAPGGTNPIMDGDCKTAGYEGLKAADLAALMAFLIQAENLLTNVAVTTGSYGALLNRMRSDR